MSKLAPALDMFAEAALQASDVEVCGALIYRHIEPVFDGADDPTWISEVDFVQLENIHETPAEAFMISSDELGNVINDELASLRAIAGKCDRPEWVIMSGFSPLLGIVHSHPGGTTDPSHADYKLLEAASTWRRATAPQAATNGLIEPQFYEADFLFVLHKDEGPRAGTLIHFKRGSKRGEWKGNF